MIRKRFNHKYRLAFIDQVPYIGARITVYIYTDVGDDYPRNIKVKNMSVQGEYVIINKKYKCKPI